jgi:hypothetical protein
MNATLRIPAIWLLLAIVIHTPGLEAQASQSETGLAKIDATSRSVTNGLVQTLRSLPRENEKYRLQIGSFALDGQQVALGSLWANNLATFLASETAAQGSNIALTLQDAPHAVLPVQADFLVQGGIVVAGDTIRVYTRLIRMADGTVARAVWSDLSMDPVLAGLVLLPEPVTGIGRDPYEPDSRESPLRVNPGEAPMERTLHANDEDWFMVQALENGILVVETTGAMDTLMALFAPGAATPVQEDDDSGEGTNALIEYPVTTGQTVLVRVSGYDGETGSYRFSTILEPLTPRVGLNDTRERALPLPLDGESRRHTLDAPEKAKWYSLTIPEGGGVLQARTTGSLDMLMELYDAQGRKLAEDDDSGEDGNALLSMLLQAGQYYLKLYEYEGNQGIYRLEAKLVALGPADQYEPDDTREEAKPITLGSPQNRNFNHPGDIDWAVLDLRQAGTYGISARPPRDNGLDTYIELHDASGQLLGEDDDGGRNLDSYLEAELEVGRYYIKVWQLDAEVPGDGGYELLIRRP